MAAAMASLGALRCNKRYGLGDGVHRTPNSLHNKSRALFRGHSTMSTILPSNGSTEINRPGATPDSERIIFHTGSAKEHPVHFWPTFSEKVAPLTRSGPKYLASSFSGSF